MRCFTLSFPDDSPSALTYFEGYAVASRLEADQAQRYVHLYHYMSIYGAWPADIRYLQNAAYQRRWDEFIGPRPLAWETGWQRLADQLAEIAGKTARV